MCQLLPIWSFDQLLACTLLRISSGPCCHTHGATRYYMRAAQAERGRAPPDRRAAGLQEVPQRATSQVVSSGTQELKWPGGRLPGVPRGEAPHIQQQGVYRASGEGVRQVPSHPGSGVLQSQAGLPGWAAYHMQRMPQRIYPEPQASSRPSGGPQQALLGLQDGQACCCLRCEAQGPGQAQRSVRGVRQQT